MKKILGFGSKKRLSPSRASATPRRDSGVGKAAPGSGYSTRDRDLGKLHKAASTGDVAKVQQLLLLRKHDLNETDKMNRTPLHLASANGYPDVVSLLVERKCRVNVWDSDSRTPLIKAVQCQQEECATILLEHGADPNLLDNNNDTALHYAALGHSTVLVEKLLQYKAEIEAKNKEGYTPLLLAIQENRQEMVDFFLKNGADVNASDKSKRTALMIAVSGEPTGMVSLLLQYDVNLSCQDFYGWTAEEYAIVSGYPVHQQLINQYRTQKKLNRPPSPQISIPYRASDTEFTLGAPAMDKEEEEEDSPEVSVRSEKPGADDSWPTTDEEELDFNTKKISRLDLTKLINSSQQIRENIDEKSSSVETEHRTFLEHNPSDSKKDDVTFFYPKPLSQAQCSPHPLHPIQGSFPKSFQMMSTLLDIDKEELAESEEEKKYDELIDISTRKQTQYASPNIPREFQAHRTSQKFSFRRELEEEENTEPSWDSEHAFESLLKGSTEHISAATHQTIKESISKEQLEDYPETYSNYKAIEPTTEMKDDFTNQETEIEVKEKQKSDASNWNSSIPFQKSVTCRIFKDLNFDENYPCKSLPQTPNQSGSTEFGKIPLKEDEMAEPSARNIARPGLGFMVVIPVEKPVPQKQYKAQPSPEKEDSKEDLTHELEFKGSSEESQENVDRSDQEQVEEEKKEHEKSETETLEEKDGDELNKNRTSSKTNQLLFSLNNNQLGKDEENIIPQKEIAIMSISSSEESLAPAQELLKGAAKEILDEKSKVQAQMDADEPDDLTQSCDTTTEGYDFPTSNCNNVMLLIEQLRVDCKDSVSLLKIQDAVLTFQRSIKHKDERCILLIEKVKHLENKITELQEELSETKKMQYQLEHQKVEWDRELCMLGFTLKQEEEKRLTAEMLFEKIREQLRRKEEQYSKEVELKQQLELTLRTLDLELRTVRNNLKQVEEERSDIQRQLSQELSAKALQEGILNNYIWKQREKETAAPKMIQSSEVPDSHEKEKELLHKNHSLQQEVGRLNLELDTVKIKNREKENRYTEENEILKDKNNELEKQLKLNEEALTKTVFLYSGKLNVLTTENALLNSKLENEKHSRDRLEIEIESYRSHPVVPICDHELSQTSELELEHTSQREREEWLRLLDKLNYDLSSLRDKNGVLSQQLSKAESKANRFKNELYHVNDSFRKKAMILKSTQRDLNQAQYQIKELEHTSQMEKEKLNKYIVEQESMQEKLAQIQSENVLLKKQLEDTQNKEEGVSDIQVQFSDLFNIIRADSEKQVLMVEERNKELINECDHLRAQMQKYEHENAEREGTVRQLQQELAGSLIKQSMSEGSLELTSRCRNDLEKEKQQLQKEVDEIKSKLENEGEKLKKLIELKESVENRLDQEIKRNDELQKDIIGFRKLLKTTKKKLKEYEKRDLSYQWGLKHTHSEADGEINRLKNKIDDLTQQLEASSSKCMQLESMNRSLREELFSMKILQKKCDRLEKNKSQLEEEVANLNHHLEINMLERTQIEQYKREIEERARQEIVEKLKEVNLFLQTQAVSQENLEQLRENNNTSMRNQMEHRIEDLESELSKMKNSQDSTKAELERYRQLYSEELKTIRLLSNKLDSVYRTNERLTEVNAKLLNEKQKNENLISSFTAIPVLEPSHVGDLNSSLILNRHLLPRGNLGYSAGPTVTSQTKVDTYLAKMRLELERNISRELDEATTQLESGYCRASSIGTTDESTRMLHPNQDPVSRATQEYLEVLKKNYML